MAWSVQFGRGGGGKSHCRRKETLTCHIRDLGEARGNAFPHQKTRRSFANRHSGGRKGNDRKLDVRAGKGR